MCSLMWTSSMKRVKNMHESTLFHWTFVPDDYCFRISTINNDFNPFLPRQIFLQHPIETMITISINISHIIWFVSSIIHPQSIRGNEEMESPLAESLLVSSARVPVIVISHIHIYDCNFFSCTWVKLWYPNITIFIYKFGPKILIWYLFNLQLSIVWSKTLNTLPNFCHCPQ